MMVVFPCLFIPHSETFVQLFVLFNRSRSYCGCKSLSGIGFQAARRFIGALWDGLLNSKRPVETGQQDESCPRIQVIVACLLIAKNVIPEVWLTTAVSG